MTFQAFFKTVTLVCGGSERDKLAFQALAKQSGYPWPWKLTKLTGILNLLLGNCYVPWWLVSSYVKTCLILFLFVILGSKILFPCPDLTSNLIPFGEKKGGEKYIHYYSHTCQTLHFSHFHSHQIYKFHLKLGIVSNYTIFALG